MPRIKTVAAIGRAAQPAVLISEWGRQAHMPKMAKRLMAALAALITLSGCGFDEAGERLKCENSNVGHFSDMPARPQDLGFQGQSGNI
jgi:hypothetical protein